MSRALLILAQVNPLDSLYLDSVIDAQLMGDKIVINYMDEDSKRQSIIRPRTEFLMQNLKEFGIEVNGE